MCNAVKIINIKTVQETTLQILCIEQTRYNIYLLQIPLADYDFLLKINSIRLNVGMIFILKCIERIIKGFDTNFRRTQKVQ